MEMETIKLEIPKEIASQIKVPPKKAKKILMQELAIRLFQQGIITSGQGASLLKMKRLQFEWFLAENEIPIHSEPENLESELFAINKNV